MKKIIFIILIALIIPCISFAQTNQEQINDIQKQIKVILIQIQELQTLLSNLQRSQNIKNFNMPETKQEIKQEIKKEEKKEKVKSNKPAHNIRDLPLVSA